MFFLFFFGHCFTVMSRASLRACTLALVVKKRNSFCVLLYLESKTGNSVAPGQHSFEFHRTIKTTASCWRRRVRFGRPEDRTQDLDPAPITMSLTTTPTSRFGFSRMWGKFCHSCFEITGRTGFDPRTPPPWVRHCAEQQIYTNLTFDNFLYHQKI